MSSEPRPAPSPAAELARRVVEAFQAETQYAPEALGFDFDLESELGIDSVTLTSILVRLGTEFGLPDGSLRARDFVTIRSVVERLASIDGLSVPPASPASAPLARREDESATLPAHADSRRSAGATPDLELMRSLPRAERGDPGPGAHARPPTRTMQDFLELPDRDLFAKARAFRTFLEERRRDRSYWYGMAVQGRSGRRAVIFDELEGRPREFLVMASNDYLGLANHPKVIEAIRETAATCGATHTGSRIIGGTNQLHKELEARLARFKGTEAAIVFPSGYSANLGAVSALVRRRDVAIGDRANHMSLVDGCKLSGGLMRIYAHRDMEDLERVLVRSASEAEGKLVVTDGVFSMHGDIAPLPEIVRLARAHGAKVLVDDAHATGVLGATGAGTSEHFGLKGEIDIELGTFSKALAGVGGFVCASGDVVEYMRFYAHSYVFAATIPAPVVAGLIAALNVLVSEPERTLRLRTNIRSFKALLAAAGFDLGESESAIVPVLVGDHETTLALGRAVRDRGLFCQAVVYPGVPEGEERLRLSLSAEHTDEDLALAAGILDEAAREVGLSLPRSS
ncbi:MAG: aminotransferase class I/II-fold pyridoxal phosphate-dependent enzyme [Planctomycetes bacterium]|nr:aminotransferase class I/II-fold pyridoxal phosphate-dependent enzyme [Planctomycetota bacterium]